MIGFARLVVLALALGSEGLLSLSGCMVASPGGSSSGDHPQCVTYCHARTVKGCGGDESLCKLACNVAYQVASSEGKCQSAYVDVQDCENDPSRLDLGCAPPQSALDPLCKMQSDALAACEKARDGN